MQTYPEATEIKAILDSAKHVVVVQADNPDADSLASALALEDILAEQDKAVSLYCGVEMPSYLRYMPGADRVSQELPGNFDVGIIVDTSSETLLEQLKLKGQKSCLPSKPVIFLDHLATPATIDYAKVICSHPAVATGEIIYELADQLDWKLSLQAKELIAMAILSDSLGLTSEATTARSIHIIAELVEGGVKLAQLENARRETMRREPELIHYKGRLLERVEFYSDDRIALVTIPWEEIEKYSPLYNPPMLVIDDMRLGKNTSVAICLKVYKDGKITGKIRSNYGSGIAGELAEHFGGGGHPYAAGFKLTDGQPPADIKAEVVKTAIELLDRLEVSA